MTYGSRLKYAYITLLSGNEELPIPNNSVEK
jgi:hypothetical protein